VRQFFCYRRAESPHYPDLKAMLPEPTCGSDGLPVFCGDRHRHFVDYDVELYVLCVVMAFCSGADYSHQAPAFSSIARKRSVLTNFRIIFKDELHDAYRFTLAGDFSGGDGRKTTRAVA
jgi:hypothetical protein